MYTAVVANNIANHNAHLKVFNENVKQRYIEFLDFSYFTVIILNSL